MNSIPDSESYVLDRGSLLHRLSWKRGTTYGKIAIRYVKFTISKYGMATVIFDGYSSNPSIKDNIHQSRQHKHHPTVHFDFNSVFASRRLEDFLSVGATKEQIIKIISKRLKDQGFKIINTSGDADVDIVIKLWPLKKFRKLL